MNPLIPVAITLIVFLSPLPTLTAIDDTNGDPVLNSAGSYYLVPYGGSGGGLTLGKRVGRSPCQFYITRTTTTLGLPVTLSSPLRILILPISSRISISFTTNVTGCGSLVWQVTPGPGGQSYVTAGGGPDSFNYSFAVEEGGIKENTYKIRTICPSVEKKCGELGIIKENGLLGITNGKPLIFQFKKASDPGDNLGNEVNYVVA